MTANTIQGKFRQFHRRNPDVYNVLVTLARNAKNAGHEHFGIGMLWEVLRWQRAMKTTDDSGWKLNNDYRAHYARLIMRKEHDLKGFFETRSLYTK